MRAGYRPWTALLAVAVALAGGALAVPAALASGTNPVIADCNAHGRLTQHYTIAQLQTALSTMPATVKEYTNCSDVINAALVAELNSPNKGADTGGSGGSFLPTPVIVILVLLVLGAITFAALTVRRGRDSVDPDAPTEHRPPED